MKLQADTKDAVLFIGGLVGVLTMTVLAALNAAPGPQILVPLLTLYAGMMGLPYAFELDRRRRQRGNGNEGEGRENEDSRS